MAVNDRDRFTPVTLTGEYPVSQFVVDSLSDTKLLDDMRIFLLKYSDSIDRSIRRS